MDFLQNVESPAINASEKVKVVKFYGFHSFTNIFAVRRR